MTCKYFKACHVLNLQILLTHLYNGKYKYDYKFNHSKRGESVN